MPYNRGVLALSFLSPEMDASNGASFQGISSRENFRVAGKGSTKISKKLMMLVEGVIGVKV